MDDDIERLAGALREVSFSGLLREVGLMVLLIPMLGYCGCCSGWSRGAEAPPVRTSASPPSDPPKGRGPAVTG